MIIKLNYPKPSLSNNGFNVFMGHPEIALTELSDANRAELPFVNGVTAVFTGAWIGLDYSDGTHATMWVEPSSQDKSKLKVS